MLWFAQQRQNAFADMWIVNHKNLLLPHGKAAAFRAVLAYQDIYSPL